MIITIYSLTTGRALRVLDSPPHEVALNFDAATEAVHVGAVEVDATWFRNGEPIPLPPRPGEWAIWDYVAGEWIDPRDDEAMEEYHWQIAGQYHRELTAFAENTINSLATDYRIGVDRLYAMLMDAAAAYIAAYDAAVAAGTPLPGWGDSIELRGIARQAAIALGAADGVEIDPVQQRDVVVYLLRDLLDNDVLWRKRAAIIRAEVDAFNFKVQSLVHESTDQADNIRAVAEAITANITAIANAHPPALDLMLGIE